MRSGSASSSSLLSRCSEECEHDRRDVEDHQIDHEVRKLRLPVSTVTVSSTSSIRRPMK